MGEPRWSRVRPDGRRAETSTLPYLVQRRPAMIAPAWLKTATQPIPNDAVLEYPVQAPSIAAAAGREVQRRAGPTPLLPGAGRLIDETIRSPFVDSGRPADFRAYVDEVRAAHKPKRNLRKLMDGLAAKPRVSAEGQ